MSEVSQLSSIFIFSSSSGELFALNQSEAMFAEPGEHSQNMLSEAFWTLNITSLQFNKYSQLGSQKFTQLRTIKVCQIPLTMFTKQMFAQLRTGLRLTRKVIKMIYLYDADAEPCTKALQSQSQS